MGPWESFSEPPILTELRVQCTRSTVRDNVSQYAMQELLVNKFEQKRCNKRKAYWWTKCKQIRLANACNVHSNNMRAKMWPSFSIRWMSLLTEVCAKEPTLVIKQRSQVMSRGQYRLVTQKGRLFGLNLFVLLVSLYNWSILIFSHSLRVWWGAVIVNYQDFIFWFPPSPIFQKIS